MASTPSAKVLPSCRWLSLESCHHGGTRQRLEMALAHIDKSVLLGHAERIKGQRLTLSSPFSAAQHWVCFELVAEDGSLVVARVRLPGHPDSHRTASREDEAYAIGCEMATMQLVGQKLAAIRVPRVYAYEGPGSQLAEDAGGVYMLLEGFYGNTLHDVEPDMGQLPMAIQEHITAQWARIQAELATLAYPQIGSVSSVSPAGVPVIGRLASAPAEGLGHGGPFCSTSAYLRAVGQAAVERFADCRHGSAAFARIGALAFCNIVSDTGLFEDESPGGFPLCHMRLGTRNILVGEHFDFLAITDWDFCQTAPWPVVWEKGSRQELACDSYRQHWQSAERDLVAQGRPVAVSFARVCDSPASRIYACFSRLGRVPEEDGPLVHEMVRLAFGWTGSAADDYLARFDPLL